MRERLHARCRALIESLAHGGRDDHGRDALLSEIASWQRQELAPYARLWRARGARDAALGFPAMPTDVFRVTRLAAHEEGQDLRTFRTSGTTSGARGAHHIRDLSLYDAAAKAAARHALFPDRERISLLRLIPEGRRASDSSLSYMVDRFEDWFGIAPTIVAYDGETLQTDALIASLEDAVSTERPIALLSTSFALVFALDVLGDRRFALPPGSRIMQTGGYKGRTRSIEAAELRALLSRAFGVPPTHIVAEYGMTELSSQMYELDLRRAALEEAPPRPLATRALWVPGWVRATVVDPETLLPLPDGAIGLLRIDDAANLDSVVAIQTADLATASAGDIFLHGRAAEATPRGCSLSVEEALGSR